jgi:hypothetical protein
MSDEGRTLMQRRELWKTLDRVDDLERQLTETARNSHVTPRAVDVRDDDPAALVDVARAALHDLGEAQAEQRRAEQRVSAAEEAIAELRRAASKRQRILITVAVVVIALLLVYLWL